MLNAYVVDLKEAHQFIGSEGVNSTAKKIGKYHGYEDLESIQRFEMLAKGVIDVPSEELRKLSKLAFFEWVGDSFGFLLPIDDRIENLFDLTVATRLLEFSPPFGFPKRDEFITHLEYGEAKSILDRCNSLSRNDVDNLIVGWIEECVQAELDLLILQYPD